MPYYIYHVTDFPFRQLKKLEQHDSYSDASARSISVRGSCVYCVIHSHMCGRSSASKGNT